MSTADHVPQPADLRSAAGFPVRNVLLCVSGGVSAALMPGWTYWARRTYRLDIRVVLTEAAQTFVSAAALSAFTGNDVATDDMHITGRGKPLHVLLARWAELAVVAPATGNTIAKLAQGIGDNLLCVTVLHCRCPVVLAPSLNDSLLLAPSTRRNLGQLRTDGWGIVPTVDGISVADETISPGAMPDAPTVFEFAETFIEQYRTNRQCRP